MIKFFRRRKQIPKAQQWLKNHSCPEGQQRFLAETLTTISIT